MRSKGNFALLTLHFALLLGMGCGEQVPPPKPLPQPTIPFEEQVKISGRSFEVQALHYFDGWYPFIKQDCVCLHIELVGGGMTVEMARELLGEQIPFEPSEDFWFFHFGTNSAGQNWQLQNDWAEKFAGHSGWFSADYAPAENHNANHLVFEWELKNGATTSTQGRISAIFERRETI